MEKIYKSHQIHAPFTCGIKYVATIQTWANNKNINDTYDKINKCFVTDGCLIK